MTETVLTEDGVSYLQTTGSYSNKSNYVRVKISCKHSKLF